MEVARSLNLSFRPMDLRHDRFELLRAPRPRKEKLGIVAVADFVRLVETARIAFPG
jgi:hypothetical protein